MTPFARLLRAECRKAADTRAARWLLAATVLLAIAAQAVPLVFPHDVTENRASFLTWAALGMTRLLPIALILAMTAEWSQRTALSTFTLEPRRGRVLAAKILAGLILAVIGGCLAFGIAQAGLAVAVAAGRHPGGGWSVPELAGFAVFMLATSGIGIAIGSARAQHGRRDRHLLRPRRPGQRAADPRRAADRRTTPTPARPSAGCSPATGRGTGSRSPPARRSGSRCRWRSARSAPCAATSRRPAC